MSGENKENKKANTAAERVHAQSLDPKKRASSFSEVCLGYSEEEAAAEASRCLLCANPQCKSGCPASIDIPAFISKIQSKEYDSALAKIRESSIFPGVCGRVCPYEQHCEKSCILQKSGKPVSIGKLERFAADNGKIQQPKPKKCKQKVAVIGTGPASLSCAAKLAENGYDVTAFEALHKTGGVLRYGVPEFRLPRDVLDREIAYVSSLGVKIVLDYVVGKTIKLSDLAAQYSAVFIGTGAGAPIFLGIEGEELRNVYSANEFLTRVNLMNAHKFPEHGTPVGKGTKTVVIGGGNVAMDAARVARRLGAEVTIIYRRSFDEITARHEEIRNAQEEGINILTLTSPVRIMGNESVECIECIQMRLGSEDEYGRKTPFPIEGTEFGIEADQVIIAVGQNPNPLIPKSGELLTGGLNRLRVDENLQTSMPNVFAGGDAVSGSSSVIAAIRDGIKAAKKIDEFLNKNPPKENKAPKKADAGDEGKSEKKVI